MTKRDDRRLRVIVNGKKAQDPLFREAVYSLREEGYAIEVRVTWEYGDIVRFVEEAANEGVERIAVAGGDGSVNEAINGLMRLPESQRPALGIVPMGTANDFAAACEIPPYLTDALLLALQSEAVPVDAVRANERYFVNVASGGFGAQVVAETPQSLKNFLGGGAYTLSAVIKALNFTSHRGRLVADDLDIEEETIAALVCNGRQAGGGQIIAPYAYIDDGWLDIVVILEFPIVELGEVIAELTDYEQSGVYVKRFRKKWIESIPDRKRSVNLDGEPYEAEKIRFEVVPGAIPMLLPETCPMLIRNATVTKNVL